MTDTEKVIKMVLTARQYTFWQIKKDFLQIHGKHAKQSEIACIMGIKRSAVSRMQKRIGNRLHLM